MQASSKLAPIFRQAVKCAGVAVYAAISATATGVGGMAMLDGTEQVINNAPSSGQSLVLAVSMLVAFGAGKRMMDILHEGRESPTASPPSHGMYH